MENILIILNSKEIEPALRLTADMESYRIYTHDPHLIDHIRIRGLKNVEFFNWENCIGFPECEKSALDTALLVEARLAASAKVFFPEMSIQAWQYPPLVHMYLVLKWFSGLWRDFPKRKTDKYFVFVLDNPSILNLWSYLPSVLLLELLNANGFEFSAFSYGGKPAEQVMIPNLIGKHQGDCGLLTHIPTCVYDFVYFNEELAATGKPVINLESSHSNVPVFGSNSIGLADVEELIPALPEDLRGKMENFTKRIHDDLSELIGVYIKSPAYRDRQAQQIARVYRSQVAFYFLLQQYFHQTKPAKIIISDHDAGIHGPLISFAQDNGIPVVMLPHSKRTNDIPYDYEDITCLTHPIQGASISNGNGKPVRNFRLSFPEALSGSTVFPPKIENICLILNELCCTGVYYTRINPYLDGIRRISAWCSENKVTLSIRCKPSMPFITLLTTATGIEISSLFNSMTGPMTEFTKGKDLCLMYDAPTSGIVEFLRASVPVLNPVPEPLSPSEASTVHTDLVPRGSIEEILGQLDSFMKDRANFLKFRNAQFGNYVSAFKDAQPLRAFL